ncbi:type I-B CRISPR-associated protein Cas5 [Leptotrichia sp. OH3620_COT-345]|uniref:type I-B CRISPR-associated protein Cas5b n=1 Tax=Leptotrichia sp. OH3620_COT-345 TaxID=2491048 RepID=UPI000F64B7CB|nr:type I-B CRISPR-associated protein Cas5b [Leptotrichia sp. OH3620_COT-345]RRD39070.1 type I-B CRISPR-associated protein Cas5 [Leptotrichia sp. OH3620_COT-345]
MREQAVKFTLKGKTAFFKQPDVNSYVYFTYGHIHKIALLGIFGSILGLKGYNQQGKKNKFPEFYEKLKEIEVSIIPKISYIPKSLQVFNNSVGYASKEEGGNLIVKEQWLVNPEWAVYLKVNDENEILKELKERLLNYRFIFNPYLGKNDHFATIENTEILNLKIYEDVENIEQIDSIFPSEIIEKIDNQRKADIFKYEEFLPVSLNSQTNHYEYEKLCFTNNDVELCKEVKLYSVENKIIYFI